MHTTIVERQSGDEVLFACIECSYRMVLKLDGGAPFVLDSGNPAVIHTGGIGGADVTAPVTARGN